MMPPANGEKFTDAFIAAKNSRFSVTNLRPYHQSYASN